MKRANKLAPLNNSQPIQEYGVSFGARNRSNVNPAMANEHRDVRIITSAVNKSNKDIEKLRRENRNLLAALMSKEEENNRLESIVEEYE